jgi:hypothetical protein
LYYTSPIAMGKRKRDRLAIRTYISEPDRGPQSWIDQAGERHAVYANRRRIRGARGKRLLRRRGELLERPCAHLYETGGLRRTQVRGHGNVLKRLLVHVSAFNLGLWMRTLFGIGCRVPFRAAWRRSRPSSPSRGTSHSTWSAGAGVRTSL